MQHSEKLKPTERCIQIVIAFGDLLTLHFSQKSFNIFIASS